MTTKQQVPSHERKVKYATRLAKALGKEWHERAGECYMHEEGTIWLTHVPIEWYFKITYVATRHVNVKVCYRLPGMKGFHHLDRLMAVGPIGRACLEIKDQVRELKEYASMAISTGYNAAQLSEVKTE